MDYTSKKNLWSIMVDVVKRQITKLSFANETFDIIRNQMKGILDEPSKLIEFLCEHLKPKEFEKKKNGEVFTPPSLINEKFDKLTEIYPSIWSNPNLKFLDPANGIGNYPALAFHRLMEGLKDAIPNEDDRKKHILENMLYMCELNSKNVEISRKLFDPENKFKLNLYHGSFFDLDNNKEWGIEKFDVIMGNPPYQDSEASGDNKKYLTFTTNSIKILKNNGILIFITPRNITEYILLTGKNRCSIDILYNICHMSIETSKEYFKNVSSTFIWFILENREYQGTTTIDYMDGKEIKHDTIVLKEGLRLPRTITPLDISIISKITSETDIYDFKDFTFNGSKRRIRKSQITKKIVTICSDETHKVPIIDTINKTNPFPGKYYFYNLKDDSFYSPKIVFSGKGYLNPIIDRTFKYTYSDNFKYIESENLESVYILFTSSIMTYLLKQFSMNGFDKISVASMIKKIELKNDITENDLYSLYRLTEEEIQRIKTF